MKNKNKKLKSIAIIILTIFIASCQSSKDKLIKEINEGEAKLFGDSIKAFDKAAAEGVFKNYILFADTYKDDTTSAAYLFKAGDLSNGLERPQEAIAIFERLRNSYPEYRKAATALFMQGFIYETSLKDKEMAKKKYSEFIQKYPDHPLTPSAKASFDQLNANMTDEELIRSFEKKNQ